MAAQGDRLRIRGREAIGGTEMALMGEQRGYAGSGKYGEKGR